MSKANIAAILREDTKTVKVRFLKQNFDNRENTFTLLGEDSYPWQVSYKEYTYFTTLPLKKGDMVIVPAMDNLAIAIVDSIVDGADVDVAVEVQYKWVVAPIDFSHYQELMERNKEIEKLLAESYKKQVRKSFREQILGAVDSVEEKATLKTLLGVKDES